LDVAKTAGFDKSEKITINVGLVDLGQIDLLVSEGFFANRTDFILRPSGGNSKAGPVL